MKKEEYINTVISYMVDKTQIPLVQREISDHILDRIDYYRHCGFSDETSEQKALEHMGDARELGIKMNYLYDFKKLNTVSLIGLILLGINIIAILLLYLMQIYTDVGSFFETVWFLSFYGFNSIMILLTGILYLINTKTRNFKHLIAAGVLGFLFYSRFIYLLLFVGYDSDFEFRYMIEMFSQVFNILSNDVFSYVAFALSVIFILIGIITAILSLGYGIYIKSVVDGKAKTSLNRAYERFAYIPVIIYGFCFLVLLVLLVLILKGEFINV